MGALIFIKIHPPTVETHHCDEEKEAVAGTAQSSSFAVLLKMIDTVRRTNLQSESARKDTAL